jgi:hypothetical protein
MRHTLRAVTLVFLWLALAASAHADKRVALVIGNAGYQSVPRLTNPTSDAAAVGAALQRLGFTVRRETDVGFDAMRRALKDFAGMSAGADIAVIYYAGHGMEIGGENYLVPVDAKLATDVDVPYEAISLNLALGAVEGARGTRLIILDACRNNPFLAKIQVGAKSRSISRGLARVEPDLGTLVAYSAKEGTTAEDGDGEHSPFTKALLQHIEEPGIDVEFLLREVRDTVREDTDGKQEPFTYGSLPGKAVLLSPAKAAAPTAPTLTDNGNEIAAEVAFWNTVKDSGDRKLLESYLTQYPNGRFASLAGIFIARLDSEAAKPPPATPPAANPASPAGPAAAGSPPTELPAKGQPPASQGPAATALASTDAAAGVPAAKPTADAGGASPSAVTLDKAGNIGAPSAAEPSVAAASPAVGQLAALQPPSTPVDDAKTSPDLIRNIQKELVRLGCSAGAPDGVWGKKGHSAVEAFARYAKISIASLDPSENLLTTLQSYGGRACPLNCGARYEAKGDSCVLKTCPRGEALNGNGICAAPPPPSKQAGPLKPSTPAGAGKKVAAGGSGGGGCVKETAAQCQGRMESDPRARGASPLGRGGMDSFMIEAYCSSPANRICH